MKRKAIRTHLQPYSIVKRRKTTINHAFASALALNEEYDDHQVAEALRFLGQDPDADLLCSYCEDRAAETWDHIFGLVSEGEYFGYGHSLGNLLPCCKQCNSRKGGKDWREFLMSFTPKINGCEERIARLECYIARYAQAPVSQAQITKLCPQQMAEYMEIREAIISLMGKADDIAASVRRQVRDYLDE